MVGRWTRDQEVAGSTPTAALFGQQPQGCCPNNAAVGVEVVHT